MARTRTTIASLSLVSLVAIGCSSDEPAESPTEEPEDDVISEEERNGDDGEGGLVGSDLDVDDGEGDE